MLVNAEICKPAFEQTKEEEICRSIYVDVICLIIITAQSLSSPPNRYFTSVTTVAGNEGIT